MEERNLPIKIILQRERDTKKNLPGGNNTIFVPVTKEVVDNIVNKFKFVEEYYSDVFNANDKIPAIGKIIMRDKAIATSHKPNLLCSDCEIIGAGHLNEVYIKITRSGVNKTINKIYKNHSNKMKANLSTIEDITPIYPEEKISVYLDEYIRSDENKTIDKLKIKLFKFDDEFDNHMIYEYVKNQLQEKEYNEIQFKSYGEKLEYLIVKNVKANDVQNLIEINGIRKIDLFQNYSITPLSSLTTISKFTPKFNYKDSDTIIGIIDTGISDDCLLSKYIVGRKVYVPDIYQNREHGTFVASTILFGNELNNISEEDKTLFKLYDVVAIPNGDNTKGPVSSLSQEELYEIIEEVLDENADKIKVWNLSLGNPNVLAEDDLMSDLAVFCDYVQDKYKVQFIIAAGNYCNTPLRKWPAQELNGKDRVNSPADSARALSIGSIAYKTNKNALVKVDEPSPFSRRGPGANYMIKPELVDYGGNCDMYLGKNDIGMLGLDKSGHVCEDVGTSFATPRITYKFTKIMDELNDMDIKLSKALLIHNARINSKSFKIDSQEVKYFGFGMPSTNCQEIYNCKENEITMIFKQVVKQGTHLEMLDFPYPKCLIKDGKYTGEIYMTLVYDPLVDQNYGSEYCRINFDASFGTYKRKSDGTITFSGQVPLEKSWDEKYELSRVINGFKWNPIKSYYRHITKGIEVLDGWKIRIDMNARNQMSVNPQEFILIITVKGKPGDKVYNDVVVELSNKGYTSINLSTRNQIRNRS